MLFQNKHGSVLTRTWSMQMYYIEVLLNIFFRGQLHQQGRLLCFVSLLHHLVVVTFSCTDSNRSRWECCRIWNFAAGKCILTDWQNSVTGLSFSMKPIFKLIALSYIDRLVYYFTVEDARTLLTSLSGSQTSVSLVALAQLANGKSCISFFPVHLPKRESTSEQRLCV